ncbi:hypothetical protein P303_01985 [Xylella fastidiosa MUL0034]|nr:hypothetical protein P303_01985 [Xylella fastidiosa MUL0034]
MNLLSKKLKTLMVLFSSLFILRVFPTELFLLFLLQLVLVQL